MRRWNLRLFAALALLCAATAGVASCAAAIPLIHDVATVIADITGALDQAEAVARQASVDPALAARALDLIAKARQGVDVVSAAGRAAEDAADHDYGAAVAGLLATYDELTDLLRDLGLRQAPLAVRKRLGAAPPYVHLVPTTDELRAELMREAR